MRSFCVASFRFLSPAITFSTLQEQHQGKDKLCQVLSLGKGVGHKVGQGCAGWWRVVSERREKVWLSFLLTWGRLFALRFLCSSALFDVLAVWFVWESFAVHREGASLHLFAPQKKDYEKKWIEIHDIQIVTLHKVTVCSGHIPFSLATSHTSHAVFLLFHFTGTPTGKCWYFCDAVNVAEVNLCLRDQSIQQPLIWWKFHDVLTSWSVKLCVCVYVARKKK